MRLLNKKHRKIGAVILFTESFNHVFDFVVFPAVLVYLGFFVGWMTLTILAFIINYYFIYLYRKVELHHAVEWIHNKKNSTPANIIDSFIKYILLLGHIPAFIFLSWEDPSKAYFYIRGHKLGEKFVIHDWNILFLANALGTLIWSGMWTVGIDLIRSIF